MVVKKFAARLENLLLFRRLCLLSELFVIDILIQEFVDLVDIECGFDLTEPIDTHVEALKVFVHMGL